MILDKQQKWNEHHPDRRINTRRRIMNGFMALITDKVPQNVPGKFYVDSTCIYCGLCDETAPTIFRECNEQGWAYVFKQPETLEELHWCQAAVDGCPTTSIGTDGDRQEK
jgi:ferredoxin